MNREEILLQKARLELRMLQLQAQEDATKKFLSFAQYMWPDAIIGAHHKKMADAFDKIASGKLKRLIINMPPRHTKSEFASYLLPAFLMGRDPRKKIIQATHTGELAVRFGRKVRNLMDSDRYKEVFKDVALRADSKAAGRWDTSHGGEYFACLRRYALVSTRRGVIPAGQVRIGDELLNAGGWVTVQEVFDSEHGKTVSVAGLDCSVDHPIWTMNRGWVYAGQLDREDVLCVESILDKILSKFRRKHGTLGNFFVQALVQHQIALHKFSKREVEKLRRAWDFLVRAVAGLRELQGGHGEPAYTVAYSGEGGQRRSVQSGELSLGASCRTGEQPARECALGGVDAGTAGQTAGDYVAGDKVSDCPRPRSVVPVQAQEEELRLYGAPAGVGRLRRAAAWVVERGGKWLPESPSSAEGNMARVARAAQKLCGLLLGVRRAGVVRVVDHGPRDFVNFLTDGDHTFFADGVLTHNCGVGGAMTGRGADLLIIDDPHSEQDAVSDLALENAWDWYTSGPRSRLQPGGAVVVVMTRWGTKDLTARLLKAQTSHRADQWEVIEFPAILPSGKPLWPEFWALDELLGVKASLSAQKWNAMYQQQPTNDEGAILKREWWKVWEHDDPPQVDYIIQSYDTAYSKKETADFSVITTWGVFYPTEDSGPNIILLAVRRGRWDFPELKRIAKEEHDYWKPDNVLIEAKATGITLQQELRRVGIPVTMYSPGGRRAGQDKVSRANSVAPILESGMVWAPYTDWAEELVEECAAFPNGDHDDMVDSTTQALMRFRAGNFIVLGTDMKDDEEEGANLVPEYY